VAPLLFFKSEIGVTQTFKLIKLILKLIILHLIKKFWDSPTLTTWLSLFVSSGRLIILMPLILKNYEKNEVEFWLLSLTVTAFSNLLDFGFFSTISRAVSYTLEGVNLEYGSNKKVFFNDKSKITVQISRLYAITIKIFTGIVFITLFFLLLYSLFNFFIIKKLFISEKYFIAFICFSFSTSLILFGKLYKSFLHGYNQIALINRWNTIWNILLLIFSLLIVTNNQSVISLIIGGQIILIIGVFRDYLLFRKYIITFPRKKIKSRLVEKKLFNYVWPPTWRTGIGILGSGGVIEGTGLIISSSGSPNVASYLLALRLMSFVSAISKAPFYSKLPKYSMLRASNRLKELTSITKKNIIISLSIFVFLISIVTAYGNNILELLGSQTAFVTKEFWLLMSIIWLLERYHAMHAQIYSTTNHIPFYIPITISGIINLILLMNYIDRYDIWAILIAHGISNLIINNWYNVKISISSLETTQMKFILQSLVPFIAIVTIQLIINIW